MEEKTVVSVSDVVLEHDREVRTNVNVSDGVLRLRVLLLAVPHALADVESFAVSSSRATSFFMSARGLSPMTLRSHVTALSYPATVADLIGVRFFLLRMRPARISLSHQSACSLKVVKGPVTSLKLSTESTPVAMMCSRSLRSADVQVTLPKDTDNLCLAYWPGTSFQ